MSDSCELGYGQRINFELLIFSLTLSMQISVSIDSDRTRNGQPPQILGAIGHPRYNGISELTDFVITGLHCTYNCYIVVLAQRYTILLPPDGVHPQTSSFQRLLVLALFV